MSYQLRIAPTFRKSQDEMRASGDPYYFDLLPTIAELQDQPFHNPELQTHQLRGAPRGTYTTDVGGRRSDRRIAWRLVGRTIVLLLYGKHAVQNRACRMSLEIDDTTDKLVVHETPVGGGRPQPVWKKDSSHGRCFQWWTDAELQAMGFESQQLDLLRAADTDDEVEGWEGKFGIRALNLYLFHHVDGEEAAAASYAAQAASEAEEIQPTADDLALEAELAAPRNADEFLEVAGGVSEAVLARPIEDWMIYIHPEQVDLAVRNFDGPARIHGASGTGKTVVGLHRAAHLARSGKRVLFTSFVSSLMPVLETGFRALAPVSSEAVDFIHLQAVAREIVHRSGTKGAVTPRAADEAFDQAFAVRDLVALRGLPKRFLREEIDSVIRPRSLHSLDEYLALQRSGRRTPLDGTQRGAAWALYENYRDVLNGRLDHNDFIDLAVGLLTSGDVTSNYDTVIVDESQDLSLLELKLAAALAGTGPNSLVLLGDGQQSLYAGAVRLSEAGLNVEGRSVELRTNYRNTEQVLDTAFRLVKNDPFPDGDEHERAGDRQAVALRAGDPSMLAGFADRATMREQLVRTIREVPAIDHGDIGILVATNRQVHSYITLLTDEGIPALELRNYDGKSSGRVKVGTYQRAKGLEFKRVLLPGVDDRTLLTPATSDVSAEERWEAIRRELFVAMGRARDHVWIGWAGDPSRVLCDAGLVVADREAPVSEISEDSKFESTEPAHLSAPDPEAEPVEPPRTPPERVSVAIVTDRLPLPEPADVATISIGTKRSGQRVAGGWGDRNVPLIPSILQDPMTFRVKPKVMDRLGVDDLAQLGEVFWATATTDSVGDEFLDEIVSAVSSKQTELSSLPAGNWPSQRELDELPLRARTSTALRLAVESSLRTPGSPASIGDLLALRSFGVRSLLDFMCVAESALAGRTGPSSADQITVDVEAIGDLAASEWARVTLASDPRLAAPLPFEVVISQLADDVLRADEDGRPLPRHSHQLVALVSQRSVLEKMPLDEAFSKLALGVIKPNDRCRPGVLARYYGLVDGRLLTLEEAAAVAVNSAGKGVTRERIRQLTSKLTSYLDQQPVWLPAAQRLNALWSEVARTEENAIDVAIETGVLASALPALVVEHLLQLLGVEVTFEINSGHVGPPDQPALASPAAKHLKSMARPFGFVNLEVALDEVPWTSDDPVTEAVDTTISLGGIRLDQEWIWLPTESSSSRLPIANLASKLSWVANGAFTVDEVRNALVQRSRFLGSSHGADVHVPSEAGLLNLFRHHDLFEVDAALRLSLSERPRENPLSDTEKAIVNAIRAAPGMVLSRSELIEACDAAGVNEGTAQQYLVYGSVIKQAGRNAWTLVGAGYSRDRVLEIAAVGREDSGDLWSWESDDTILGQTALRSVSSPIYYVPAAMQPYLASRRFTATDDEGHEFGELAIDDVGKAWGTGSFLRERGANRGDLMELRFSLDNATVELRLLT
jgi:superfamily I DNA/RNA helicase